MLFITSQWVVPGVLSPTVLQQQQMQASECMYNGGQYRSTTHRTYTRCHFQGVGAAGSTTTGWPTALRPVQHSTRSTCSYNPDHQNATAPPFKQSAWPRLPQLAACLKHSVPRTCAPIQHNAGYATPSQAHRPTIAQASQWVSTVSTRSTFPSTRGCREEQLACLQAQHSTLPRPHIPAHNHHRLATQAQLVHCLQACYTKAVRGRHCK